MVRLDYIVLRQAVPSVDNFLRNEVQSCVAATVAFQQFPSMTLVPVSPAPFMSIFVAMRGLTLQQNQLFLCPLQI